MLWYDLFFMCWEFCSYGNDVDVFRFWKNILVGIRINLIKHNNYIKSNSMCIFFELNNYFGMAMRTTLSIVHYQYRVGSAKLMVACIYVCMYWNQIQFLMALLTVQVVPYLLKFLDNLTNIYVRFNRKRLKGRTGEEDCRMALSTLYNVWWQ